MDSRKAFVILAVTGSVLGGAAPAGATSDSSGNDVPWAVIAASTARCLDLPESDLPAGLAVIKIPRDLPRLRDRDSGGCFAKAADDPVNPVRTLITRAGSLPGVPTPPITPAVRQDGAPTALAADTGQKACVGLPVKTNIQNIVSLVNVGIQDIPILSSAKTQQCVEDTAPQGSEPVSHLIENLPALTGGGE